MELIRVNPSNNILSGNPMPLQYYISPWAENIRNSNIFLLITISSEIAPGSGSYLPLYSQKLMPGQDGELSINLNDIVSADLKYHLPSMCIKQPEQAVQQIKKYRIAANLVQNGKSIATDTSYFTSMKGGAGIVAFNPDYFSLNADKSWFNDKKWLGFYQLEKVHKEDVFFLFFLKKAVTGALRVRYSVTYLWGDVYKQFSGFIGEQLTTAALDEVYCVPAGWQHSGIAGAFAELNASGNMTPVSYQVDVVDGSGEVLIEPVRFALEQHQYYNTMQLLYRNSLGGLQHLRLYGQVDIFSEYSRNDVKQVTPPSYVVNEAVRASLMQNNNEEVRGFKANTGWLNRYAAERLRDFFLSPQRWEILYGRLIPIKLNGGKVDFYSARDNLISVGIEFSHAISNRHFTTGTIEAQNECPAVKSFTWKQTGRDVITIYWALPFGHEDALLTITFPGEAPETIAIEGNAGSQRVPVQRPSGSTGNIYLTVSLKVACASGNGPEASVTSEYKEVMPIVAAEDVFIAPLASLPYKFPQSVLDNDYDPEGKELEVEAEELAAFNPGPPITYLFKADIDEKGFVTVTVMNDNEYNVWYKVRAKGTTEWTVVNMTIKRGNPDGGAVENYVYVKVFYRNIRKESNTTYGDVFIETFKDAECTKPLVVNNLTISWKKIYKAWVTGYEAAITETPGSSNLKGVASMKIYSGKLGFYNRGGGNSAEFEVQPSPDYVKVN